jgi:hypothetical protein
MDIVEAPVVVFEAIHREAGLSGICSLTVQSRPSTQRKRDAAPRL